MDLFIKKSADISSCKAYRYALYRTWDESKGYALFIGLNPSTADEVEDDPTIRRCMGFSRAWGYGGLVMVNLFAYRATEPSEMMKYASPIGEKNDGYLESLTIQAGIIIAAWGVHGQHMDRASDIMNRFHDLHCLGITKGGHPRHPLYVKGDMKPIPFS